MGVWAYGGNGDGFRVSGVRDTRCWILVFRFTITESEISDQKPETRDLH